MHMEPLHTKELAFIKMAAHSILMETVIVDVSIEESWDPTKGMKKIFREHEIISDQIDEAIYAWKYGWRNLCIIN